MTLATKITFIRMCVSPVVFILFWINVVYPEPVVTFAITIALLALATVSEISDAIDGKLARSRNEVTDFGKLFDPFSDSVYRFTFFFCFWWLGICPAWMVVVIFYRETAISFLRLVLRGENVVLAARKSGKIKAIVQAVAIFIILLLRLATYWAPQLPVYSIGSLIMLAVVIMTLVSMMDYIRSHWSILKQIPK